MPRNQNKRHMSKKSGVEHSSSQQSVYSSSSARSKSAEVTVEKYDDNWEISENADPDPEASLWTVDGEFSPPPVNTGYQHITLPSIAALLEATPSGATEARVWGVVDQQVEPASGQDVSAEATKDPEKTKKGKRRKDKVRSKTEGVVSESRSMPKSAVPTNIPTQPGEVATTAGTGPISRDESSVMPASRYDGYYNWQDSVHSPDVDEVGSRSERMTTRSPDRPSRDPPSLLSEAQAQEASISSLLKDLGKLRTGSPDE